MTDRVETYIPFGLPTGSCDFGKVMKLVQSDPKTVYLDKSRFIKKILEDKRTEVVAITCPRRFGKTLDLSRPHRFLEKEAEGLFTQPLFEGLKITQYSLRKIFGLSKSDTCKPEKLCYHARLLWEVLRGMSNSKKSHVFYTGFACLLFPCR